MTNCIGLMGKVFGHRFKEFLIEYIPWDTPQWKWESSRNLIKVCESLAHRKYKIICTRCGEEKK